MALDKRRIIQYMIANSCVKAKELEAMLKTMLEPDDLATFDNEKMHQLIQKVNKTLKNYSMMIRSCMDELTIENYYVLISTVDNEITRAASHHSPKQFEFFKMILHAVVEAQGKIPEKAVKDIAERVKIPTNGSAPEHLQLLNQWYNKKWLAAIEDGGVKFIRLGVRSIAELDVLTNQW